MIAPHEVSGLVLAGGRGRRMQQAGQPGVEKGLMRLHGRHLVAWAAASMPQGLARLYISANRQLDGYADYGDVVTDHPAFGDDSGPLAGVASVLREMPTQWLYTAPVDVPRPPTGVFQSLVQHAGAHQADLVYVRTDRPQPLFMLVNKRLLSGLEAYLASGSRQVQAWQRDVGQAVELDGGDHDFFNVNTPDDLLLAHRMIPAPDSPEA